MGKLELEDDDELVESTRSSSSLDGPLASEVLVQSVAADGFPLQLPVPYRVPVEPRSKD